MNFVKYQNQLKTLLHTEGGKPYSGCYVYSRVEDDTTMKLGMSEAGLFKRISQAKSCYPYKDEMFLHFVIVSLDGQKKAKGTKSTTRHIETELLTQSKHMSTVEMEPSEKEEGNRPTEYRILGTSATLHKLIQVSLNKHREKWDYLVVFSNTGWNILPNDRLKEKPISNIRQLNYNGRGKKTIASQPINSSDLILHNSKAGDKINNENWKTFTITEIIDNKHVMVIFDGDKKKEYQLTLSKGIK